jgi:RNA polymerase sigma factor (sigma-70 family)
MVLATIDRRTSGSLQARAERLARLELMYVFDESFTERRSAAELLRDPPAASRPAAPWKPDAQMPAHLVRLCERELLSREEERHLFRRMNFAKYRADLLRRKLDPRAPRQDLVERIEELLALARHDRDEIITANTRLAISIVRKLEAGKPAFDELLSEAIESLLRAVDRFDFARGFRFSTYATTAIRRTLWRALKNRQRDRDRLLLSDPQEIAEQLLCETPSPESEQRDHQRRQALDKLLASLSPRERLVVSRRYGLETDGEPQTLQSLAGDLGVCKERVRQIEGQARQKLRAAARALALVADEQA